MNRMMFLLGLLFGFGLLLSGMSNPQKVQDFLDVLGRWDASLAFVMGGAVLVTSFTTAAPSFGPAARKRLSND